MQSIIACLLFFLFALPANEESLPYKTSSAQETPQNTKPKIIAYYSGNAEMIDQYPVEKLDQIIYSFCHLKGNRLNVDNARDTVTIERLVALKQRNPKMEVLLSLGGWGGCKNCSPVFSTDAARKEFAASVLELTNHFKTDGLDLDWEYPAIPGYEGHPYMAADKDNFTALVQDLRNALGPQKQISFAAGGFDKFINESIDWAKIAPLVDNVNLMSYDLVSGFSTVTGHHTSLFSTPGQQASMDNGVKKILATGFPKEKIVVGCGFYARTWEGVKDENNGLYQSGKFKSFVDYKRFPKRITEDSGFVFYWDDKAKATHAYNKEKGIFATFDDDRSVAAKTKYVEDSGLKGIMFWELATDKPEGGLLDVIYKTAYNK